MGKPDAPAAHLVWTAGWRLAELPKWFRPKMKTKRMVKAPRYTRYLLVFSRRRWSLSQFQVKLEVNCSEQREVLRKPLVALQWGWQQRRERKRSDPMKHHENGFAGRDSTVRQSKAGHEESCIQLPLGVHTGDNRDFP